MKKYFFHILFVLMLVSSLFIAPDYILAGYEITYSPDCYQIGQKNKINISGYLDGISKEIAFFPSTNNESEFTWTRNGAYSESYINSYRLLWARESNAVYTDDDLQVKSPRSSAGPFSGILDFTPNVSNNASITFKAYDANWQEVFSDSSFRPCSEPSPTPNPSPTPDLSPTLTPTAPPTASPTPAIIPGDLNNDNKIDIADFEIIVADFGKTGEPGFIPADLNVNGKVEIFDYNTFIKLFNAN